MAIDNPTSTNDNSNLIDLEVEMSLDKRIKNHITGPVHHFFIATAPQLNQLCFQELMSFCPDVRKAAPVPGGVVFNGRIFDCFSANLRLRTANRIIMRVAEFKATHFAALEQKIARIPWELYLQEHSPVLVSVSVKKSRLYHDDAVGERVLTGIGQRIPTSDGSLPNPQTIFIRGFEDRFVVSLDSSGDLLYKRGIKQHGGKAPLRETLAAAALQISGYSPDQPFLDPMCGSGTFSLEAAMIARHIPAGWFRRFAFMDWPAFSQSRWDHIRKTAGGQMTVCGRPIIFASDLDENAIGKLQNTIVEYHLTDAVKAECKDFFTIDPSTIPGAPGLIAVNPPYGLRLDRNDPDPRFCENLIRHLLDHYPKWSLILVLPEKPLLRFVQSNPKLHVLPIFHGGLNVFLVTGRL